MTESYKHKILQDKGLSRIPIYYGYGYFDKRPFIISEYIENSLEEYLKLPHVTDLRPTQAKLRGSEVNGTDITPIGVQTRKLTHQQVFLQMLEAVQEIHKTFHIHKDIKPDNFRI
jgi:serine/threonine protein kinase